MKRLAYWAFFIAVLFGIVFWHVEKNWQGSFILDRLKSGGEMGEKCSVMGAEWLQWSSQFPPWFINKCEGFSFIYFSIVTFTTLGFGDITPTWWLPQLLVIIEVLLGYSALGLMISILAKKVASRAD